MSDTPSAVPHDGAERSLRFTPLDRPDGSPVTFPVGHIYVELVCAPLIGPTAVLLVRRVDLYLSGASGTMQIDGAVLAREIGVRASDSEALGRHSPLLRALGRLIRHQFVVEVAPGNYGLYRRIPALDAGRLRQLPASARRIHHQLLANDSR